MKHLDIGVDLDGCAYGFTESLREFAVSEGYDPERLAGGGHDDETASDWEFYKTHWDMDTPEFLDLCHRGVDAGVIFLKGEPFPGAVETIRSLKDKGHYIHVVTNRAFGTRSHHNTSDWLNQQGIPYDSLIFSGRKHLFSSLDIMVDDYEVNFNELWKVGVTTYLFDRPWNRHVDDRGYRVWTWQQFELVVDDLAHR